MKVKLTKKWKRRPHSHSFDAVYGYIYLRCYHYPSSMFKNGWAGIVRIYDCKTERIGPIRKSIKAAQQDAQRLAVELLRDIRDGTKALMDYYEMGEDD